MEQLLHYVWKHKIFPLKGLRTTAGLAVEVIDPGLPNTHAGPDFFNAKLKIDGTLWVGNVEIHTLASDWYRHGHNNDKAYDSVILHVCQQSDREVYRTNGELIPQMLLACPEQVKEHYEELRQADRYPPCYSILSSLSPLLIHSWLTALQTERFMQKTQAIRARLEKYQHHWEDVLFLTLARNFGFGLNGDAFEAWGARIPYRAVDKHRDNLFQVEAFFFGQAGLLEAEGVDEYYQKLQKEFRYLQRKFELPPPLDVSQWRFLRLRPHNFPHVRLAQLAFLYHREQALFSRLMEAETVSQLRLLLSTRTSAYWETHFRFESSSLQQEKQLGGTAKQLIIINTVIPFLYAYGLHKGNEALCERATRFLEELKAENNEVTRRWHAAGLFIETAADSQALLQLQREYCDKKRCLFCRFGYAYLRHK